MLSGRDVESTDDGLRAGNLDGQTPHGGGDVSKWVDRQRQVSCRQLTVVVSPGQASAESVSSHRVAHVRESGENRRAHGHLVHRVIITCGRVQRHGRSGWIVSPVLLVSDTVRRWWLTNEHGFALHVMAYDVRAFAQQCPGPSTTNVYDLGR